MGYHQQEMLAVPANKCQAMKTDAVTPCGAWAVAGSSVCWHHGGATQANRNKAMGRVVTQAAQSAAMIYGAPIDDITPEEALTDELARTAGHVAWLQEQLATSDPSAFAKSMWFAARQSGYVKPEELDDFSSNASAAIWVDLYMKERNHLVKVAATAIGAGLEERKVQLAERMVAQVGDAVTAMLEELGHDPADPDVRAVAFRAITRAASGEVSAA